MEGEIEAEKSYSTKQTAAKLRRLAAALEEGRKFEIQIAGNKVTVPPDAAIEIEYERNGDEEEIEIELKWSR